MDDSNRLSILLERYSEKKNGAINGDLMVVINCNSRVENLKAQLRFAELELSHAMRGLDHKDYDFMFEGWAGTK